MKDYLNNTERLTLISAIKNSEQLKELSNNKNLFTNKEKGDLKRASTYIYKVVASVLQRLNKEAIKTFNKAVLNTKVFISSNSDIKIYEKRKSADLEAAYEENKEYFKLVELILFYNCANCTKNGSECDFYKEFENQCVPEFDEVVNNGNCKYSYQVINKD